MERMVSFPSRTGRQFQRYDEGCRQVVGCIPYRYRKPNQILSSIGGTRIEEIEVLLISSQKGQRMMFPKGGWEIDESIEEAALRETREEAGVVGIVEPKLGRWSFKSKSKAKLHEGHMFPMLVKEQLDDLWPERDIRQRRWMTIGEAQEICESSWMKEALDEFVWRLMNVRHKEEENLRPCLLEFLRTEEHRLGINVVQSVEEIDQFCSRNHSGQTAFSTLC